MSNEMDQEILVSGTNMDQVVINRLIRRMDNPRLKDEDWLKDKRKKKTLRSHRRKHEKP